MPRRSRESSGTSRRCSPRRGRGLCFRIDPAFRRDAVVSRSEETMTRAGKVRRAVLRGVCGAFAIALAPGIRAQAAGRRRVAVFHWLDRKQYAEAYPRFFSTLAERGWKEG